MSMIKTNFPLLCSRQLEKGFLITKRGKGVNALYDVEKVIPQKISKEEFSTYEKPQQSQNIEGEKWIECFINKKYEVSNLGKIRRKDNHNLMKGSKTKSGYIRVCFWENKKQKYYSLHQLILQSFSPIEDYSAYTVNHINGIRSDNRLENLEWCTSEENTLAMLAHRQDLNKELTRIIQKIGYDKTLELLKSL